MCIFVSYKTNRVLIVPQVEAYRNDSLYNTDGQFTLPDGEVYDLVGCVDDEGMRCAIVSGVTVTFGRVEDLA